MKTALRVSVADLDRMIEEGAFADNPDQRLELIQGELREMSPPSPPHDYVIDLLMYWSVDHSPREQVHVRIQNALGIPAFDSVPMPDIAWMKRRDYRHRRPEPRDVLLLIEVAASSLAFDRGEKAELYATAGLTDYWIVNLKDFCLEIHRQPHGGRYQRIETFRLGQSISPLAFPQIALDIGTLFTG